MYFPDTFSFENSFATIQFKENGNKVEAIFTNRINQTKGVKTDKPIPVHNEIQLNSDVLKRYIGVYEINPNFNITITLEDSKLMSQATGQGKFEIFPDLCPHYLFLPIFWILYSIHLILQLLLL